MKSGMKIQFARHLWLFIDMVYSLSPISSPHVAGSWYVATVGSYSKTCLSPARACVTINGALNKPGYVAGETVR